MASCHPRFDAIDLSTYDLSLDSVYLDYPKECLPQKLVKSTQPKAKELKLEIIDENVHKRTEGYVIILSTKIPAKKILTT
jgi:hypothetical protein